MGRTERRAPTARSRVVLVLALAAFVAVSSGHGSTARAQDIGGDLTVEAAVGDLPAGDAVSYVRVGNTGTAPILDVVLEVQGPSGVTVGVQPARIDVLESGASVFATVQLRGTPESSPAAVVVLASGSTGASTTVAATSIGLVAAPERVSLSLVGNTRLTDESPAELLAVLTNAGGNAVEVTARASAEPHAVLLAASEADVSAVAPGDPITVTVPARGTAVVHVVVLAEGPLRRGSTGLVVRATPEGSSSGTSSEVVATRELDVALSADALPAALGGLSVLVVPGVVGVWAYLAVMIRDRRRIGLTVSGAGAQIWENKLLLLVALAASLLTSSAYRLIGFPGLLDTYTVGDVAWLVLACGGVGAGLGVALVAIHRRWVPAVTPSTSILALLAAAGRHDPDLRRPVFDSADGRGLLVQGDRGALILTPPVHFSELDLQAAMQGGNLVEVVKRIEQVSGAHRLRYAQRPGYLLAPRAVTDAKRSGLPDAAMLEYSDVVQVGG